MGSPLLFSTKRGSEAMVEHSQLEHACQSHWGLIAHMHSVYCCRRCRVHPQEPGGAEGRETAAEKGKKEAKDTRCSSYKGGPQSKIKSKKNCGR